MVDETIKKEILNDINKVLNEIKYCKSKSRYFILDRDISTLYFICEDLGIKDYPKIEDKCENSFPWSDSNLVKKVNEMLSNNYDYHLKFSENFNNFDYYKYLDENIYTLKNDISIKESLEIAMDFLKQYDLRYLKVLEDAIKNNKVIYLENADSFDCKDGNNGYTVASLGSFKPYIVIKSTNNIFDCVTIVHELAHYYDQINNLANSNKIKINKILSHYEEVNSHFMGFALLNYLQQFNIFNNDIKNIYNGFNFVLYDYLKEFNHILMTQESTDYNKMLEIMNYSYGITLAYHYYDMYLNDKEKAKYCIEQFETHNGYLEELEMLDKFGIKKEELLNSKILKKYI